MTALGLLKLIAGREESGYVEVRWFEGDYPKQAWHGVDRLDFAVARIESLAAKTDVFVGCAPRFQKGGGKESIRRAWCLWVDADTPEAVERVRNFTPAPTMMVASGTPDHLHCYWSLNAPMASPLIEQANRRLAHHLGADPKCAEVARILRPPGTLNHKTPDDPRPVEIVEQRHHAGYPVSSLVAHLPDPPALKVANEAPHLHSRVRTDDDLLAISPLEYVPRLSGREVNGRGFIACVEHAGGNERTPSLKVYADPSRGFKCYGCGVGGDIYSFAGLLWNLSTVSDFPEIKRQLREVFG